MKRSTWIGAATGLLLAVGATGIAQAKLPPPTEEEKAKMEEAKRKAEEAAKKEAEALARVQDMIAERYKRAKAGASETAKPVTAAAAKETRK
ncbi:hypothetical protein [Pelomicrobium sp.]|jgi:hypothetical protein|uniref:hypothetical protein n=1 Tax=Pelomicrobium sp. TaxID=2815319 RepID=UPI002FDCF944